MEITSIASPNYNFIFKYRHLNCSHKSFVQEQRRTRQRLIPLTEEILKTMADFNTTPSNTSMSDKQLYNTLSITGLVREEVHKILQELSISEKYIRKEEIDNFIEKCLKGKAEIIQADEGSNDEIDDFVGVLNESEKNKLIVENFEILEQRITDVEKRLSDMMHNIPKIRANKFKINTKYIKDELCGLMEKMQVDHRSKEDSGASALSSHDLQLLPVGDLKDSAPFTIYDDIVYYERKENIYNLWNYKKSATTLKLNERVHFNPYVKPILITLPDYRPKIKQRTTFIENNV